MKEIMLRFAHNEYLVSVATSISDDLTNAFAIGPEAQLESHLQALPGIANAAGLWMQLTAEDGSAYFYNGADGVTQWEATLEYTALSSEMADIVELVERLDHILTDVNIQPAALDTMFGLLQTHASDVKLIKQVMVFIHALTVCSGVDALNSLSEEQGTLLIATLQALFAAASTSDQTQLEEALAITEALCAQKRFQATLTGEEYIRVLCDTCRTYVRTIPVLIKGFSTLSTLATAAVSAASACVKYGLHEVIVLGCGLHVASVKSAEVAKIADSTAPTAKKYALARSNTTLISEASGPVNFCYTTIGLLLALLGHENAALNKALCIACTDSVVGILNAFAKDTLFVSRLLLLLGKFSLDDECIEVMLHKGVVAVVVEACDQHKSNPSLVKVTLELFSNLASCEAEESEEETYRSPNEIILAEGAVVFTVAAAKKHEDKPAVLCAALDALYNAVDATSALDVSQCGVVDVAFAAISRYDYDRNVLRSVMQLLVNLTDMGVALDTVCGESGDRLVTLLLIMENNLADEELLLTMLHLLLNVFAIKENRDLLAASGNINCIFAVLAMHTENLAVISLCITILGRLSVSDDLSEIIAEKGCRLFMDMVTSFIESPEVVAAVFALLGQLAFVKSNLKSIVQYGGIKILLDTMTVFGDEEALMISAVRTLDNIVSADEEYALIVIEKGGKSAVEKVKSQYSADHEEIHDICGSALLSISARARAKGREGTKTNKGALFARLNDVVDIEAAMKREADEVKGSSYDSSMQ
ncbi:unnamed protein product, partial [Symbiodinium microadriaticum]